MERSVSGVKERGTWESIVEHGERITNALRNCDADEMYPDAFDKWNEWRPKHHETLDGEISAKTAEQASTTAPDTNPDTELGKASDDLSESLEKLTEKDSNGAVAKWRDSISHVGNAVNSAGGRTVESVEKAVYENVMTRVAPYYFDNDLVSANIAYVRSQDEFVLEVNINDDTLKSDVLDTVETLDDDIDRWHVNTEKHVETAESAEGVEAPPESTTPDERNPKPTTN